MADGVDDHTLPMTTETTETSQISSNVTTLGTTITSSSNVENSTMTASSNNASTTSHPTLTSKQIEAHLKGLEQKGIITAGLRRAIFVDLFSSIDTKHETTQPTVLNTNTTTTEIDQSAVQSSHLLTEDHSHSSVSSVRTSRADSDHDLHIDTHDTSSVRPAPARSIAAPDSFSANDFEGTEAGDNDDEDRGATDLSGPTHEVEQTRSHNPLSNFDAQSSSHNAHSHTDTSATSTCSSGSSEVDQTHPQGLRSSSPYNSQESDTDTEESGDRIGPLPSPSMLSQRFSSIGQTERRRDTRSNISIGSVTSEDGELSETGSHSVELYTFDCDHRESPNGSQCEENESGLVQLQGSHTSTDGSNVQFTSDVTHSQTVGSNNDHAVIHHLSSNAQPEHEHSKRLSAHHSTPPCGDNLFSARYNQAEHDHAYSRTTAFLNYSVSSVLSTATTMAPDPSDMTLRPDTFMHSSRGGITSNISKGLHTTSQNDPVIARSGRGAWSVISNAASTIASDLNDDQGSFVEVASVEVRPPTPGQDSASHRNRTERRSRAQFIRRLLPGNSSRQLDVHSTECLSERTSSQILNEVQRDNSATEEIADPSRSHTHHHHHSQYEEQPSHVSGTFSVMSSSSRVSMRVQPGGMSTYEGQDRFSVVWDGSDTPHEAESSHEDVVEHDILSSASADASEPVAEAEIGTGIVNFATVDSSVSGHVSSRRLSTSESSYRFHRDPKRQTSESSNSMAHTWHSNSQYYCSTPSSSISSNNIHMTDKASSTDNSSSESLENVSKVRKESTIHDYDAEDRSMDNITTTEHCSASHIPATNSHNYPGKFEFSDSSLSDQYDSEHESEGAPDVVGDIAHSRLRDRGGTKQGSDIHIQGNLGQQELDSYPLISSDGKQYYRNLTSPHIYMRFSRYNGVHNQNMTNIATDTVGDNDLTKAQSLIAKLWHGSSSYPASLLLRPNNDDINRGHIYAKSKHNNNLDTAFGKRHSVGISHNYSPFHLSHSDTTISTNHLRHPHESNSISNHTNGNIQCNYRMNDYSKHDSMTGYESCTTVTTDSSYTTTVEG